MVFEDIKGRANKRVQALVRCRRNCLVAILSVGMYVNLPGRGGLRRFSGRDQVVRRLLYRRWVMVDCRQGVGRVERVPDFWIPQAPARLSRRLAARSFLSPWSHLTSCYLGLYIGSLYDDLRNLISQSHSRAVLFPILLGFLPNRRPEQAQPHVP